MKDLARLDQTEIDYLEDLARTKRSGDVLNGLKTKIGQGIKSKLGLISQGSSHYSQGNDYDHHEEYPEVINIVKFIYFKYLFENVINTN